MADDWPAVFSGEGLLSRWRFVPFVVLVAAPCALSAVHRPPALFVWNVSESSPKGLYWVEWDADIRRGDIVVATFPDEFRKLAAMRNYLPQGVPIVKRVAAAAGDRVCANGQAIRIDGRAVAKRRKFDALGRPLPAWQGCVDLRPEEYFLLGENPYSLDARYFGITHSPEIVGRAVLMWRE